MKPSEMQDIFEPVVEHVIELVWDQITATNVHVKAVLLVGGFGQSSYLKERIRSALIERDQKIEVLQPPNAWTAVVRGAVMKGLANHNTKLALVHVGPRAARKHYGLRLRTVYDEDIHAEDTR
jgi:molecular chaperone DnaK (HSP70)